MPEKGDLYETGENWGRNRSDMRANKLKLDEWPEGLRSFSTKMTFALRFLFRELFSVCVFLVLRFAYFSASLIDCFGLIKCGFLVYWNGAW